MASMSNFGTAINATNTALSSQGSAAKENERAIDSLEGHINNLKSAWEKFSTGIADSDMFKSVVDSITSVIEGATSNVGVFEGVANTLSTIIKILTSDFGQFAIKAIALVAIGKSVSSALSGWLASFKGLQSIGSWFGSWFSGITDSATNVSKSVTNVTKTTSELNPALQAVGSSAETATTQIGKMGTTANQTSKAASTLSKIGTTLSAVASIAGIVGTAIGVVASAISAYNAHLSQKADEAYSAWEQSKQQIESNEAEIEQLASKTNGLTDAEKDRLAILEAETAELKNQQGYYASTALSTSAAEMSGGVLSSADGWTEYEDAIADLRTAGIKAEAALRADSDKSMQKHLDDYTDLIAKQSDNVTAAKEYLELVKATEEAGGQVTEEERKIAEQAQKVVDQYDKITEKGTDHVKALRDTFTNVDWSSLSAEELAGLEDRYNEIMTVISGDADEASASFNKLNELAGDTISKLGSYDKDKDLWSFDTNTASLQDFADALGISTEMADEMLNKLTESGKVKWTVPEEQLNGFMTSLSQTTGVLENTDGKMVTTEAKIREMASALGVPTSAMSQFINAYKDAGNSLINFNGDASTTIAQLAELGSQVGVVADKSGNIKSVNIQELAQAVQSMGGSQDDFAGLLQNLSGIEDISFEGLDEDFKGVITGTEQAGEAAEQAWEQLDSAPEVDLTVNTEEATDGVDDLAETIANLPEDEDITIQAVDEATGNIENVTVSAEELAANPYIAKLSAEDQASTVIAYSQAVALGFDGGYTAWLKAVGGENVTLETMYAKAQALGFEGNYEAYLKAINATDSGIAAANTALTGVENKKPQVNITAKNNTAPAISAANQALNAIDGKTATTYINTVKTTTVKTVKKSATGKRKGEPGGLSWVGDEGSRANPKPELIQTKNGAYLAGTTGWEMVRLSDDDIVYSNTETKKLLGDGYKKTGWSPRFASGTPKFLSSSSDKKSVKKKREKWDAKVSTWEYNVDVAKKTQTQYVKWLKKQVKKSNRMTKDQYREAKKTIWSYYNEQKKAELDTYITKIEYGKKTLKATVNAINKARKQRKITDTEQKEYLQAAYEAAVEYDLKQYENGKKTYKNMLATIKKYYKKGKITAEDYYGYLDDLASEAQDKEVDRLTKLQEAQENQQDLGKQYAELQVDNIEKQIEAIEELNEAKDQENELQEKQNSLTEAYNNLTKARQQKVRVYRDGQFVYEEDIDAVKEAQEAVNDAQKDLDDFNAENATSELEKLKDEWQAIVDMFGEQDALDDIKQLELELGTTVDKLFGDYGTDISKWLAWYQSSLATTHGYEDIITTLENLEGYDAITKYLNSAGQVNTSKITTAINQNKLSSGSSGSINSISTTSDVKTNISGATSYSSTTSTAAKLLSQSTYTLTDTIKDSLDKLAEIKADSTSTSTTQTFNFDKLVLPNVSNAEEFVDALKNLPNLAIQSGGMR